MPSSKPWHALFVFQIPRRTVPKETHIARQAMSSEFIPDLGSCSRCKTEPAVLLSRKELFCRLCFIRFISGKQRRHMSGDKYKVKFGESVTREKVVLPLSFGASSLVLLDILLTQFNEQSKNQRVKLGFELEALYIDDSAVNSYNNDPHDLIESIKSVYGTERFPFKVTVVDICDFSNAQKFMARLRLDEQFMMHLSKLPSTVAASTDVVHILKASPNRASRHDLQQVIMTHIVHEHIRSTGASSILWGHNMSTLAEQVLSLTVKGRGSEIHLHLTDSVQHIDGIDVDVIHPLRDASRGEISKFVQLRSLDKLMLVPTLNTDKIMNKQKTINEVVASYFKNVDTGDDNIVSTVVKTGTKLAEPKTFDGKMCVVCGGKIYNDPMDWLRSITYHGHREPESELENELLKEWESSQIGISTLSESRLVETPVDICYGCSVTVGTHQQGSIEWPVSKQNVLDEYVIGQDDDD